jgi:hypothetical protein
MAKLVTLIECEIRVGRGVDGDPIRPVTQYWTLDGQLVFEKDDWEASKSKKKPEFGIDYREEIARFRKEEALKKDLPSVTLEKFLGPDLKCKTDPVLEARKQILDDQARANQHMKNVQVMLKSDPDINTLCQEKSRIHLEACRFNDLRVKESDKERSSSAKTRAFNRYNTEIGELSQKEYLIHRKIQELQRTKVLEYCVKHGLDAGLFNFLIG